MENAEFTQRVYYKHLAEQGFIKFIDNGKKFELTNKGIDYFDFYSKQKPELCLLMFVVFLDYLVRFPEELERFRK